MIAEPRVSEKEGKGDKGENVSGKRKRRGRGKGKGGSGGKGQLDPNALIAQLKAHIQKDILDFCPNRFDEILQFLVVKNRTKAVSRARTGCGSNQ